MEEHFLSVETFNDLLHQWNGQPIKITKHELDDIDETWMQLKAITYDKNTRRIDDYEAIHALQLNGSGKIHTDANGLKPLPDALYEIPLEDTSLYEFDGETFILSTDRGIYKIELANEQAP